MPKRAYIFVVVTAIAGAFALGGALRSWVPSDLAKFACYLAIAMWAATLKVRLPRIESTMSVHFLFILLGVLELPLAETMIIGCAAAILQSFWKTARKPDWIQVCFNVLGLTANAIWLTYLAFSLAVKYFPGKSAVHLLAIALVYFATNTIPLAIVIALSQRTSIRRMWLDTYLWSFPYYIFGAVLAGLISFCNNRFGWESSLLAVPVMFWLFRTFYIYLTRLEEERKRATLEAENAAAAKRHVEEICALHLRTIEGLALAIEAKDNTTHAHLNRVSTYALEIAQDLGLDKDERDALRAAALLHDIGKLGVPDHIINKPGRLSSEEFEKIKLHPVLGAEIIERVAFPYPVAPIVRSHHEKWNGKGYPDGLKGEEIPIGARILAVVDCLDALASDRQYRKALTLQEAVKEIESQAGESYDPQVVAILRRRFQEFEKLTRRKWEESYIGLPSPSRPVRQGGSPDAGLEVMESQNREQGDFLSHIASARQEAHILFELAQDLGNSLSLDGTLSVMATRLRKLVPYDSIAVFAIKDNVLVPEFVSGDYFKTLSSLRIPIGKGLCGWVAGNEKPIVNGNPAVEVSLGSEDSPAQDLRSALAVPLEGITRMVGVLALYRKEPNAFTADHLRILHAITSRIAMCIENALQYREAESSATIDSLIGMANARSLSVHLERELARCKREGSTVGVLICDLDRFKEINDRFGQRAGDGVLKSFAAALKSTSREYDFVARTGGDEFAIIAPGITEEAALEKAASVSNLARKIGMETCEVDFLSSSAGYAFYPKDGTEAEQILALADRKMYATKWSRRATTAGNGATRSAEQLAHN